MNEYPGISSSRLCHGIPAGPQEGDAHTHRDQECQGIVYEDMRGVIRGLEQPDDEEIIEHHRDHGPGDPDPGKVCKGKIPCSEPPPGDCLIVTGVNTAVMIHPMIPATGEKNSTSDARYPNNQSTVPTPTVSLIQSSIQGVFVIREDIPYYGAEDAMLHRPGSTIRTVPDTEKGQGEGQYDEDDGEVQTEDHGESHLKR